MDSISFLMDANKKMTPLSIQLDKLKRHGYTANFRVENNRLVDVESKKEYDSQQLKLDYEYRTEGNSNPEDMSILFALSCDDGVKGTIVAAYGATADTSVIEFVNFVDQSNTKDAKMLT